MKDSRIGTFAALTLIVAVGLKAAFLMAVIEHAGAGYAALALIGCEAASRAGMLAFWHALPSARPGGLADSVGRPQWETVVFGCGIGLIVLTVAFLPAGVFCHSSMGWRWPPFCCSALPDFAWRRSAARQGLPGAAQQIGCLALLAGLVMAL